MGKNENKQVTSFQREARYLSQLVLENRIVRAFEEGAARYPVYRVLRFAARIELEVLFDAIALDGEWRAERLNGETMLLDGDGVFVGAYGSRKVDYCSCYFYIWAGEVARAEATKQRLLEKVGSTRIVEPMFLIEWSFVGTQAWTAPG